MTTEKILSKSPGETTVFGKRLAKYLKGGDIVCLLGDLGSGKTTLIKGIAQGLKVDQKKVNSPTFVLLNIYEGRLTLFHFDLYRLENVEDIRSIEYDEFLYGNGVSVIEWADRMGALLPKEYLQIELTHRSPEERLIRLTAKGRRYNHMIGHITPAHCA